MSFSRCKIIKKQTFIPGSNTFAGPAPILWDSRSESLVNDVADTFHTGVLLNGMFLELGWHNSHIVQLLDLKPMKEAIFTT
jgi:hypothetical protein